MVQVGISAWLFSFYWYIFFSVCFFLACFFPFSCCPLFSLLRLYSFVRFLDNVFLVIIYDWITIMGYFKYELSTINMLYSLKNQVILHPYRPITATFFCPQGGLFGEVRLQYLSKPEGLALYTHLSLPSLANSTVRLVLKAFSVFSTITLIRMLNSCNTPLFYCFQYVSIGFQ